MVSAEMAHTTHDKKKLLNRIKRIRGQLNGVEKALEEDRDCGVSISLAMNFKTRGGARE
jgi:FrmR/RcnR family transcriptional regulator, repressor of frmRAB operon